MLDLFATHVNVTILIYAVIVCAFGDEHVGSFSEYGVSGPKFSDLILV